MYLDQIYFTDYYVSRNDLIYFYIHLLKNRELNITNHENELIEEEIISFLKSERQKLLKIIPGRIFNSIANNKE